MNQKGKCLLKHFFTCHKVNLTSKKSYCSSVLKLREIFQIYFSARTKNFFKVFGPCGELRLYLKSHFVWKLTCYSPLNSPQIPALRVKVVLMVFFGEYWKGLFFWLHFQTTQLASWHAGVLLPARIELSISFLLWWLIVALRLSPAPALWPSVCAAASLTAIVLLGGLGRGP